MMGDAATDAYLRGVCSRRIGGWDPQKGLEQLRPTSPKSKAPCDRPGCQSTVAQDWHDFCGRCYTDRLAREASIAAVFPADVQLWLEDYKSYPQRRELDKALIHWGRQRCGRQAKPSPRPWLLTWGNTGAGKSTGLGRAASRALLGWVVGSVAWITEDELCRAVRDARRTAAARHRLEEVRTVELLVLDEFGRAAADQYDPRELSELRQLLNHRANDLKPTLIAANRDARGPGGALGWLDERLGSRFSNLGVAVPCVGTDLRRPPP